MTQELKTYDVVALLDDEPRHGLKHESVTGIGVVTSDGMPGRIARLEAYLILLGKPPIIPAHIRERIEREEREERERAERQQEKGSRK